MFINQDANFADVHIHLNPTPPEDELSPPGPEGKYISDNKTPPDWDDGVEDDNVSGTEA